VSRRNPNFEWVPRGLEWRAVRQIRGERAVEGGWSDAAEEADEWSDTTHAEMRALSDRESEDGDEGVDA
jgi:hypothetical protein